MNGPHPCPVCGGVGRRTIYVTRDRHYRIAGTWNVARCTDCGLVQLDPMPSAEQLIALYPSDFYAYHDLAARRPGWMRWLKERLFPSLIVVDPGFEHAGHVLDSGCGSGWSLLKFRDAGWQCIGVEPSGAAARFGREQYGLDIRTGTVLSEKLPAGQFDYIRSNHSLEHDPDCDATIAEFRRLIRADGRLLIGVPNIDSAAARWFGRYWWYLGAPVHTYNFSLHHLSALLAKHGFEVLSVRYAGNYGGILGSLQIWINRNRPQRVSTDGWLINSMTLRVLSQFISGALNMARQGDAIEVVARPIGSGDQAP
ncbi:MAG: class I SAM-dependent methyltransferase [Burkholderiales bacterium]|nr:class I SAM-dependent methyltransferase [Burkholderiales bacterium]MDE1925910.1 class I SAM-dependent methyltransferase [Burkholderiales bacterium]MDE2157427.1 class I SAM-dependent methyltransferase [Burkholderiales bacterium]